MILFCKSFRRFSITPVAPIYPRMTNSPSTHSSQPPEPEQVLQWLTTQRQPDGGEAPPLPEDLLKQLESAFGRAPAPMPPPLEHGRSWFNLRSFSLVAGLAVACLVMVLTLHREKDGTTAGLKPVVRGGGATAAGAAEVAWKWDSATSFAAELELLKQEGFTEEAPQAATVIRLDTQSDPHFVLVTGEKNGKLQGEWSLRLPKLPADAQRPQRWLQALLQLQAKLDASP